MVVEEDEVLRRARGRVGQTLRGKWRLDALLGVGGMASVYAASHRNGNRVAVKWLHPELAVDRKMRERFVLEGYIANRIDHEGVVRVLDDEVADDGGLVLLMDLLEGETVDARWQRSGHVLAALDVLRIAHSLLDVLVVAHAAGIVHRDLKPENLFLTRQGKLKVLDFGIARLRELTSQTATSSQSSLGTPAFMPPEQARGRWQEVDGRTDIWAVGATLFTLLTGRYVHLAETVNEQLLLAMTRPAPPVGSLSSQVPPELAHVVDKALAFKAAERWQTADEMRAACAQAFHLLSGGVAIDGAGVPGTTPRDGVPIFRSPPNLTTGRPVASVLSARSNEPPARNVSYAPLAVIIAAAVAALFFAAMVYLKARPTGGPTATAPSVDAPPPVSTATFAPASPLPAPTEAPAVTPPLGVAPAQPVARAVVPEASVTKPVAPPRRTAPPPVVRPRPAPTPTSDWHDRRE